MPHRLAALAAVVALAGPAWARDLCIRPSIMGWGGANQNGVLFEHCHVICFARPKEAVERYETVKKDRFEKPDPGVIEHLRQTVLVSVITEGGRDLVDGAACRGTGAPQKLIFVANDEREPKVPVLVIPLKAEEITLKNAMGAVFTAYDGSGEMTIADVRKLAGTDRGFDLSLILENYVQKEHFNNDWPEKLLK